MPALKRSDLRYEYSWKVSEGDNPKLIEKDAHHLSRNEGYEMLLYLNKLTGEKGADLPVKTRLIVEWMLKEHFKSTAPGRATVTEWVVDNWQKLSPQYPG
ncbi:hypothetical protein E4A48_11465 [Xanthomonas cerealis pv. cerealis]|uniref:Uncharacterized protein n=1 Tax=Xanthomonas cerealis pv. cerealis TaxID=152263 RepID=A0A514EDZ2_9XANT|nr:hypothetical protein [Xanthomonas translucens]QDI04229.1 hypothetical protein E4A48_11465 [Xanthomonas translucens pv. cerealis]